VLEATDGHWSAQVESLCVVHAFGPQQGKDLLVLDTLRDRLEAECACQADNRFDYVEVVGVSDQVADELDIDLRWVMGSFFR
jgi:hypothetical protein